MAEGSPQILDTQILPVSLSPLITSPCASVRWSVLGPACSASSSGQSLLQALFFRFPLCRPSNRTWGAGMAPVSGLSNLGRSMLGSHASQPSWWADMTCKELHTKRHLLTRTPKLSFHQHLPASRESKTHLHSRFSSLTLNFWPIIFSFHIIPGDPD